jgi:uncharacterized Tic20 family protein
MQRAETKNVSAWRRSLLTITLASYSGTNLTDNCLSLQLTVKMSLLTLTLACYRWKELIDVYLCILLTIGQRLLTVTIACYLPWEGAYWHLPLRIIHHRKKITDSYWACCRGTELADSYFSLLLWEGAYWHLPLRVTHLGTKITDSYISLLLAVGRSLLTYLCVLLTVGRRLLTVTLACYSPWEGAYWPLPVRVTVGRSLLTVT